MLRILINLPIKRLIRTGPDQSLTGPGILEMAKDRRPDCGCSPVRSCDFGSWLVRVRSSPGLFPVLGPDFQTLVVEQCQSLEIRDACLQLTYLVNAMMLAAQNRYGSFKHLGILILMI